MGSITHLSERLRSVPDRLVSDDEILAALSEIEPILRQAGPADGLEAVARSGLLALSIPSDFGGADIANDLLGKVVLGIAAVNPELAQLVAQHFVALEFVRNAGTQEQRRGVYGRVAMGESFSLAPRSGDRPLSAPDGLGHRIESAPPHLDRVVTDWIALVAETPMGQPALVLVPLQTAQTRDREASGLHVPGDNLLLAEPQAVLLAGSLATLLDAAVLLSGTQGLLSGEASSTAVEQRIGLPAVDKGRLFLEAQLLKAMVMRLSVLVDTVQVGAGSAALDELRDGAAALDVVCLKVRGASLEMERQALLRLGSDLPRSAG